MRVPYNPVPTAQPYERGTPMLNISTPGAAFGLATAQAVEKAGGELERVGNEQFQTAMALKKLENETITTAAKAKHSLGAVQMNEDFLSKEGLNAGPEALKAHQGALEEYRQSVRDSLPNDATKRDFDAESIGFQNRLLINSAGHSARQVIAANKAANVSYQDAIIEEGHKNPTDFEGDPERLERLRASVRDTGERAGSKPEKIDEDIKVAESRYVLAKAKGLADTNPLLAQQFLTANEKYLYKGDLDRAREIVQHRVDIQGSRNIINEAYDPKKSLGENRAKAKEVAEKYGLKRSEVLDMIDKGMESKWNIDKRTKYVDTQQAKETVADAISGRTTGAAPPKNIDELFAIPGAKEAYDNLPAVEKNKVPGQIARWNAAEGKQRNDKNWGILRGMAENEPTKFIDEDITKWDLSQGQMRSLMTLQRDRRKNSEGDPQVQRGMKIVTNSGMLTGLGISKKADETAYNHFTGLYQDALHEQINAQGGKPLTYEQYLDIAKALVKEYKDPPGLIHRKLGVDWFDSTKRFFEKAREIPPEDLEKLRKKIMTDNPDIVPDDEEIVREYARQQWKALIKKSEPK